MAPPPLDLEEFTRRPGSGVKPRIAASDSKRSNDALEFVMPARHEDDART
jgi:hypothetical protein